MRFETTDDSLREYFDRGGTHIHCVRRPPTKMFQGLYFVTHSSVKEVNAAESRLGGWACSGTKEVFLEKIP